MTAERWQQIESLFAEALEHPAEERGPFLDRVCGTDGELRRELESLLKCDAPDERLVEVPAAFATGSAADQDAELAGRRIGPYQVLRLIGRGGMGAVYLGIRADDQYEKQVAIKLLNRGMDTDYMLSRFRQERQILANLEHPFIARLLDGGATDDGLPYLVMEYVDGVPITAYASEKGLSITERVHLFRMVCEAVQYAHQHLVVHRDIKPSNILTTKEGVPKLLDFGIAKVLDPAAAPDAAPTRSELRMFTPEYASPEQVKGLPISTASDIYSLGAVLYQLLTGQRPHRIASDSREDMERAICEAEPEKPSLAAAHPSKRELAGDLDNIVLTAMHKERQRRYASAAELSEDLRRHLEALPISAQADRWTYRARKFVRRNRLAVGAALLVAASLVGGIVATTVQARRAERRFQMVRGLARGVLFDLYGEMDRLPGSTALRAKTIRTVLRYLDDLARDGSPDPELDLEIALAYERVAGLEGHPLGPNLGKGQNALISYRKALAIFERLAASGGNREPVVRGLIDTNLRVSSMEAMMGNPTAAEFHSQKAASIAQEAFDSGDPPIPPSTKINLYFRLADADHHRGSASGELAFYRKALEVAQTTAASEQPAAATARIVDCYRNLGSAQARGGDLPGSLASYRAGRTAAEQLARKPESRPDDVYSRLALITAMGDLLSAPDDPNLGDRAGARREYLEALKISERLAETDPKNVNARRIAAGCYWRLGMIGAEDEPGQAVGYCRKALRISEELGAGDPRNAEYRYHTSRALSWMGEALVKLGRFDEAVTSLRGALEYQLSIAAVSPERIWNLRVLSRTYMTLGLALAGRGEWQPALDALREGLAVADRMLERAPASLPHQLDRADVLEAMGKYYVAAARRPDASAAHRAEWKTQARTCYQKSLAIWRDWHGQKTAAPYTGRRLAQAGALLASLDRF